MLLDILDHNCAHSSPLLYIFSAWGYIMAGEHNLCLFQCLACFNGAQDIEAEVKRSRQKWESVHGPLEVGISVAQLPLFETMFHIGVTLYEPNLDDIPGSLKVFRSPLVPSQVIMSLIVDGEYRHVDLIMTLPVECAGCKRLFLDATTLWAHYNSHKCGRHSCSKCSLTFDFPYLLRRHMRDGRCQGVRAKTACGKCGEHFDVPANYTGHLKFRKEHLSVTPMASGINSQSSRKRRSAGCLAQCAMADIFNTLSNLSRLSKQQTDPKVLRKLVRARPGNTVTIEDVRNLEVACGLRINVFSRNWDAEHQHYFVTQLYTSTQPDVKVLKVSLQAPDPDDITMVNIIESMDDYSGVHACRWVQWKSAENGIDHFESDSMRRIMLKNLSSYRSCGAWFKRHCDCRRHECICERGALVKFMGGSYVSPQNVFDHLETFRVCVPQDLRWNKYRATFDL